MVALTLSWDGFGTWVLIYNPRLASGLPLFCYKNGIFDNSVKSPNIQAPTTLLILGKWNELCWLWSFQSLFLKCKCLQWLNNVWGLNYIYILCFFLLTLNVNVNIQYLICTFEWILCTEFLQKQAVDSHRWFKFFQRSKTKNFAPFILSYKCIFFLTTWFKD